MMLEGIVFRLTRPLGYSGHEMLTPLAFGRKDRASLETFSEAVATFLSIHSSIFFRPLRVGST